MKATARPALAVLREIKDDATGEYDDPDLPAGRGCR
jgi:hypothetical protein